MDTRKLTRLASLIAICVVSRINFQLIPNVQILSDIILILAIDGKLDEAIIVNAITMTVTSFYLGFGYWVIFQIVDFAILSLINFLIFKKIKKNWFDQGSSSWRIRIYLWAINYINASFDNRCRQNFIYCLVCGFNSLWYQPYARKYCHLFYTNQKIGRIHHRQETF